MTISSYSFWKLALSPITGIVKINTYVLVSEQRVNGEIL